jgi:hypothetical protein
MEAISAFLAALPVLFVLGLKAGVAVGALGTLIEAVGKWLKRPRLAAFGDTLEAIAVDIPKVIGKLQGLLGKAPAALVLCLGLACAPGLSGCTNVKPALTSAQVPKAVAFGLEAASVALNVADTITAAYLDSLKAPTDKQLADAAAVVATLQDVKDALDLVRADMAHGRERLREALGKLESATRSLDALGVKVPPAIASALAELSEVVK